MGTTSTVAMTDPQREYFVEGAAPGMRARLTSQFLSGYGANHIITCGSKNWPVNKELLSRRSPFFAARIAESTNGITDFEELKEASPDGTLAFRKEELTELLEWCYTLSYRTCGPDDAAGQFLSHFRMYNLGAYLDLSIESVIWQHLTRQIAGKVVAHRYDDSPNLFRFYTDSGIKAVTWKDGTEVDDWFLGITVFYARGVVPDTFDEALFESCKRNWQILATSDNFVLVFGEILVHHARRIRQGLIGKGLADHFDSAFDISEDSFAEMDSSLELR